jgi:hypothetical protein
LVSIVDEIPKAFLALVRRAKKTDNVSSTSEGVTLDAGKPSPEFRVASVVVALRQHQLGYIIEVAVIIVGIVVIWVIIIRVIVGVVQGIAASCSIGIKRNVKIREIAFWGGC